MTKVALKRIKHQEYEYQGINLDKSYIPIISQRNINYFGWLNSLCVPIDSPVSNHKLPSVIWYRWPIETE